MSVVTGFTIVDGWARDFLVAQTADWAGVSEMEVITEYARLEAEYRQHCEREALTDQALIPF